MVQTKKTYDNYDCIANKNNIDDDYEYIKVIISNDYAW